MSPIEELADMVDGIARDLARRVWWADVEDLRGVGWIEGLAALARFDTTKSTSGSIKPFARLRVQRGMTRYLLQNSTPVSASDHGRYGLIGLTRAELDPGMPDERTTEGSLVFERWRARVVVRLREVVRDPKILASLLEGEAPSTPADEIAVLDATRKIEQDPELRLLWAETT